MIEPGSKEYFKEIAKGVILRYIQGIRKRSTLNWALGELGEMMEHNKLSPNEIQNIISEIEANPIRYVLDKFPERKDRLNRLKDDLKHLKLI